MQKYKPYKKSFDHTYSLGLFPTLELLRARPEQAEAVIIAPGSDHSEGVQKIKDICKKAGIPLLESDKIINRISTHEHYFAIGVCKKFETQLEQKKPHLLLVNPDDSGNVGTILRTMLGFGHTNLAIIRPAVDIFDPKVIRASMGAVFKQRVAYFDSLEAYTSQFRHELFPFLLEGSTPLKSIHFSQQYCLVFGNEGAGLPTKYNTIGTPVRIEQSADIDSLNLAVAVSIALYHAYNSQN